MGKLETMSAAVREVIDRYPEGHRFHGNQLKADVVRVLPEARHAYPDTMLRLARRHRREAFRSVDRNKSLYEKVRVKRIINQIKATENPVQGLLFGEAKA